MKKQQTPNDRLPGSPSPFALCLLRAARRGRYIQTVRRVMEERGCTREEAEAWLASREGENGSLTDPPAGDNPNTGGTP